MSALASLSERVATLEKQLNRPSILISDWFESYYYLDKNRKVLFYPEITSIIRDDSFQSRFTYALKKFNPIVTVCPIKWQTTEGIHRTFLELLDQNNYKLIESRKSIDSTRKGSCDIYVKD
ncbi:hypothetical protein MICAE_980001 [Microcystis aeruginosa PCC 9806]|uniref:Uncharacterized protein n=1 Tax=Microcystis aeruginosa PCC 9806 TaxID=1160282 RepID=I4H444_MICAE|nr:hypothetical protein MICAE_980001 [Microcystis aeruginosa PCC 9806]